MGSLTIGDPSQLTSRKKKNNLSSTETTIDNLHSENDNVSSKNTRKLIEEINLLFHNLFETTNDGIFILDLDGRYIKVNKKGADLLGYSADELVGRKATDFVAEEELTDSNEKLETIKDGRVWPIFERTIVNRNGERTILEVNASSITNQEGKVIYLQTIARDISKRKEMELKLKENEEKYRVLFEEAREGIILIDAKTGRIIDANPEFQLQTGRSLKNLQELSIWELRPDEKQELAKKMFFEIKKSGSGKSSDLELQKPDGKITSIEFATKAITIGKKNFLLSISRDVSEKKLAESILIQQRKILQRQRDELDSFASTVAHDIRGKLQVISLMNELSEDTIYSEKIAEQINDTVKFLDTSLLLAKEGAIIGDIKPIDMNELLNRLVQKLISINPETTFNIQEFPLIKGDEERLYQVFENILMNAIKHSQAETVTVSYNEEESYYNIQIKDDGSGMSEETQEKIKRSWTTKKYTSFGLMIVKKIVEAHRGKLSFESEEKIGTTFYVKLPK
ncbi:MAG: PAS domain S-box protein [Asgard group archaeon]|nr:PAS domain S-box protein [Asgard group archaeon]